MSTGTYMRFPLCSRVKVMAKRTFFFRWFISLLAVRVMTMMAMLLCVTYCLMEMLMRYDAVRQHQGIG